jgi:hypothetical protein
LSENVVPIAAGDDDTTPVPSVVAVAAEFGNGRVVALGHERFLTNKALNSNDLKATRFAFLMAWASSVYP